MTANVKSVSNTVESWSSLGLNPCHVRTCSKFHYNYMYYNNANDDIKGSFVSTTAK